MPTFDLVAPVAALDHAMLHMLPPWATLVVWGCAVAGLSTAIYLKLEPHRRIDALKAEAGVARAAMLSYDADFDGLLVLVRRTLRLSFTHLALSVGPAVCASLPALLIFTYLGSAYAHSLPPPAAIAHAPRLSLFAWLHGWEILFFASATAASIPFRLLLKMRRERADA
ncbi:MAG TPA: hypothetical protein VEU51_05560 [Candidatus Acidoferrales bacterium]|nr:hypothetical protein [Candidatus Acidoferrales bacterium]